MVADQGGSAGGAQSAGGLKGPFSPSYFSYLQLA